MTPKQDAEAKLQTAYHEAGHTLVQYYSTVKGRKLRKVTIIPRGDCLGMVSPNKISHRIFIRFCTLTIYYLLPTFLQM